MTSELGYIEWAVGTFIYDVKVVDTAPFLFDFLSHRPTYISWDEKSIYHVVLTVLNRVRWMWDCSTGLASIVGGGSSIVRVNIRFFISRAKVFCRDFGNRLLRKLNMNRVPRQLVYGHFVYDTSSTDISSTTVYQRVAQLYIQLLFQQIIIFINSNFYLHYGSFLSIPLPLTLLIIQHIQLASIVA